MKTKIIQIILLTFAFVVCAQGEGEKHYDRSIFSELELGGYTGLPSLIHLRSELNIRVKDVPIYPSFFLNAGTSFLYNEIFFGFGINYSKNDMVSHSIKGYAGESNALENEGLNSTWFLSGIEYQRKKYFDKSSYSGYLFGIGINQLRKKRAKLDDLFYPSIGLGLFFMVF